MYLLESDKTLIHKFSQIYCKLHVQVFCIFTEQFTCSVMLKGYIHTIMLCHKHFTHVWSINMDCLHLSLAAGVKESGVEISAPKQMQELTLQTMRIMLQKQRKTYETLSVNYCKAPSEKLEREIRDCESIVKLLESEIASKSPPIDVRRFLTYVKLPSH